MEGALLMKPSTDYDEYGIIAQFYDYVVPYRSRQDVGFFVEMARQSKGPVLEIGCGTGRVLIPTARAGIDIVGLDLSSSMLSICKEKLSQEPEEVKSKVRLMKADMRRFDLGQEFGLVTTPFRPFQHLTEVEDQLACLAGIYRHLCDAGMLALDLFNPHLPRLIENKYDNEWEEEPEFTMPDGKEKVSGTKEELLEKLLTGLEFVKVGDGKSFTMVEPPGGDKKVDHAQIGKDAVRRTLGFTKDEDDKKLRTIVTAAVTAAMQAGKAADAK